MNVLKSILVLCVVISEIVSTLGANGNEDDAAAAALSAIRAVPSRYAAAWTEIYKCSDQHHLGLELHGLPTAFSVYKNISCTPDAASGYGMTCSIPVRFRRLRMRVKINETDGESTSFVSRVESHVMSSEPCWWILGCWFIAGIVSDEAFFKPFNTTLIMTAGTFNATDLGENLAFEKSTELQFEEKERKQMMTCARTGLDHLIACLRWAECRVPDLGAAASGRSTMNRIGKLTDPIGE